MVSFHLALLIFLLLLLRVSRSASCRGGESAVECGSYHDEHTCRGACRGACTWMYLDDEQSCAGSCMCYDFDGKYDCQGAGCTWHSVNVLPYFGVASIVVGVTLALATLTVYILTLRCCALMFCPCDQQLVVRGLDRVLSEAVHHTKSTKELIGQYGESQRPSPEYIREVKFGEVTKSSHSEVTYGSETYVTDSETQAWHPNVLYVCPRKGEALCSVLRKGKVYSELVFDMDNYQKVDICGSAWYVHRGSYPQTAKFSTKIHVLWITSLIGPPLLGTLFIIMGSIFLSL